METNNGTLKHNNSENAASERRKEIMRLEAEFAKQHKHDSDAELIQYLRSIADKLGHIPKKREILGYALIKSRFGPWPRVLEMAGLKDDEINRDIPDVLT